MSNTIDNHIEFVGTNSEIQELLGFLIAHGVAVSGDIIVDITIQGVLSLTFMTENSPADLFVGVIHDKFPNLEIEGGFNFENETTLWTDELGLDEEQE